MNTYTCKIKETDVQKIKDDLYAKGFEFSDLPYGYFQCKSKNYNIVVNVYHSLKCLVQGKGTEDFIRFYLEPQILQTFDLDYAYLDYEDKIGMDESGKGDYFGPLVVAAVYVKQEQFNFLREAGVNDSKKIKDKRIHIIASTIRENCKYKTVLIKPEKYNSLYDSFKNLNSLLAWAHATCLKNLLQESDAKKATVDKFASKHLLNNHIKKMGLKVSLTQKVKGEEDIAVAAASILARSVFLSRLNYLSEDYEMTFPKGGGDSSIETGKSFIEKHGEENLIKVAKLHFKNTEKIIIPKNSE